MCTTFVQYTQLPDEIVLIVWKRSSYSFLSRANELRASSQSVAGVKLLLSDGNLLGLSAISSGRLFYMSLPRRIVQRPGRYYAERSWLIFVSTTIVGLPAYYFIRVSVMLLRCWIPTDHDRRIAWRDGVAVFTEILNVGGIVSGLNFT